MPLPVGVGEHEFREGAEVVTFDGLTDEEEHIAVVYSGWAGEPLVRLHSECLTGDVFGSARCDCGPQLSEAIEYMQREGGIILYLRQEGRGIGLYNKLDAYGLQDQGLDTFEANRALDFDEDLRDYTAAAEMLTALEVLDIRLLTNNPDKVGQLETNGIAVSEVIHTDVFVNEANREYLLAKVKTAGHDLEDLEDVE